MSEAPEPHVLSGQQPPSGVIRALVLHPDTGHRERGMRSAASKLEEAIGLTLAIDVAVVHAAVVPLRTARPGTLFGKGKLEEIDALRSTLDAELVIVNAALSPVQQRNLEKAWNAKVLDRTALILEIFGARARTKEGRLQVELAHLTYQKSRLVRSWTHLERQRGGMGFLGGPGETQIEADRRQIAERIARVKEELELVKRTRGLHRKARQRVPYPVVALVGYTNAGKSTLFNRLTASDVFAKDLLFATLDPTMRAIGLPGGVRAILSDTVGFISDLPTDLIAAFRATLEEVQEADLILHVRDISHPETEDQRADVLAVLAQLGIEAETSADRIVEIWNKIDRLPPEELDALRARAARRPGPFDALPVSAVAGIGIDALRDYLSKMITRGHRTIDLVLGPKDGALIAWIYDHGRVETREDHDDGSIRIKAQLTDAECARLDRRLEGERGRPERGRAARGGTGRSLS